ncbi:hypothetical protein D3C75_695460 [compost metagenome]
MPIIFAVVADIICADSPRMLKEDNGRLRPKAELSGEAIPFSLIFTNIPLGLSTFKRFSRRLSSFGGNPLLGGRGPAALQLRICNTQ